METKTDTKDPLTQLADVLEGFAAAARKAKVATEELGPDTPEVERAFAAQINQTTAVVAAASRLFLVDGVRGQRELAFIAAVANSVGREQGLEVVSVAWIESIDRGAT